MLERPPQDVEGAVLSGWKDSLTDQPGIRLAQPTGRRLYFGGALTVQRFAVKPADSQDADAVLAGLRHNNTRRALGRARGEVG